jgi:hypothetical protein
MSFLSASKTLPVDPSEVNTTGFHTFETSEGEVELFVNVDDHPDGNWILATNFDEESSNGFAEDFGYTAPDTFNRPNSSGDVRDEYVNENSSQVQDTGPLLDPPAQRASSEVPELLGCPGPGVSNSTGSGGSIRSFRPDTKGYEYNEIKLRGRFAGGNDDYGGPDNNLFGVTHDGCRFAVGEPGTQNEHILDVVNGGSGPSFVTEQFIFDQFTGTNVSQEVTRTLGFSTTTPPYFNAQVDQDADDEYFGTTGMYIWVR